MNADLDREAWEKAAHIERLVLEIGAIFDRNKLEADIAAGTLIDLAARILARSARGDQETCVGLVAAGQTLLAESAAVHFAAARFRS